MGLIGPNKRIIHQTIEAELSFYTIRGLTMNQLTNQTINQSTNILIISDRPATAMLAGADGEHEELGAARTLSSGFSPWLAAGIVVRQVDLPNLGFEGWPLSGSPWLRPLDPCVPLQPFRSLGVWLGAAAMNCDGLAKTWDQSMELRVRLRQHRKLNLHPETQKFCEPTRQNCVTNTLILEPCLDRLREAERKLPYLEPLQVEISKFYEMTGLPLEQNKIYTGSVEIKKMLGFVKRKAGRKEVTKDCMAKRPSV